MTAMPPIKFVASPNYSIRGGSGVRLIVIHTMEGSYAGSIAWFAMAKSQVSAHLLMKADGSEWTQMVALGDKAWHACNANPYSIGIEGEGYTAKGEDDVWDNSMALGVAWLLHAYGLPCRWAAGGVGAGFCSHHDLGAMGGGHVDIGPCGGPDWQRLSAAVGRSYAVLSHGPLPAWALHGAPAPLAISPAPPVPPEASHGGAQRSDEPPFATDT